MAAAAAASSGSEKPLPQTADEVAAELARAERELSRPQRLAQKVFECGLHDSLVTAAEKETLRKEILEEVEAQEMSTYYQVVCERLGWPVDAALLERMVAKNDAKIKEFDAAITDARENYGDDELYERVRVKAKYFVQIGDGDRAGKAYAELGEAKVSVGQKVDMQMEQALLAFLLDDAKEAKRRVEAAKELNDKGGDWDRRNRLKVYEAMSLAWGRQLAEAAELLLSCVATFTCAEMMSYSGFAWYCIVLSMVGVERARLAKKVVNAPDLLSVSAQVPEAFTLVRALHDCRYADFFRALTAIAPALSRDRFLGRHVALYVKEMRVRAYSQFLEAYRSVTLEGIASAFGVSTSFIDAELARFIAARRLNAKINRMTGIVESTRPDSKNAKYESSLRRTDALLARVQRLARSLDV
ncbi:hypothetical protein FNF29_02991 [Cafeteria roenbergensis]|uniref:PCI domain-containing protein n=1 Tax=Cafeteria roenbergensis TaxID=33653 RepID=A0A5A8CKH2_CAFRO|nr:hypothetical protein FNF29_02991 [Cafeteria roenbergensis]|eukprot:KAA0153603.1 hypothetical protein FNF29_02991 [Cafeteria roenbergensis]